MTEKKTTTKKSEKKQVVKKKETRNLKTMLSAEELAERADGLAQATQEVERLEEEKKAAASQYKSQIEEATGRRNKLAGIVSSKSEWRQVDVELTFDYENKTVSVVRLDDGEVVQERAMFHEELQKQLYTEE
jgi:phenylalanyl-tRNA synthetase alpha subunit